MDFRLQLRSFVTILAGGTVSFTRTNFTNYHTSHAEQSAVVFNAVACKVSANCGSFTYVGGRVRLLNNGFELYDPPRLSPFLWLGALSKVEIESVAFEFNVVASADYSTALLYLMDFKTLTINYCSFSNNYLLGSLIKLESNVLYTDKTQLGRMHIAFDSNTFTRNFATISVINMKMKGDVLNLHFSDLEFYGNAVLQGSIIELSATSEDYYLAAHETYSYTSAGVFITPARFFQMSSNSFTNQCPFEALISVSRYVNIGFYDVAFVNNTESRDCKDLVLDQFHENEEVYAKLDRDFAKEVTCSAMVRLADTNGNELHTLELRSNVCISGGTGIQLIRETETIPFELTASLSDVEASENKASSSSGMVLIVGQQFQVSAANVWVHNNQHDSSGVIYLDSRSQLHLVDFICEDNISDSGTCLYAEGSALVSVSNSTFRGNTAFNNGGAIYFEAGKGYESHLTITDSLFQNNAAQYGGAVSLSSTGSGSPISFSMRGSKFISNNADFEGSAVHVGERVTFQEAEVAECVLEGNNSPMGAVALKHRQGDFYLRNTRLQGNTGNYCSGICIETHDSASVNLNTVLFLDSKEGPALAKLNARIVSSFVTNKCSFQGGTSSFVSMEGGQWTDSQSSMQGLKFTAVVLTQQASADLRGTKISGITIDGSGAAIHLMSQSHLQSHLCEFQHNSATGNGGAVAVEQKSTIQLTQCLFSNNSAVGSGAALFLQNIIESTATDCVFRTNQKVDEGVINLNSAGLLLNRCIFEDNTGNMPGIVLILSALHVTDSLFCNQTGIYSPFLYAVVESTAIIINTVFTKGKGLVSAVCYSSSSEVSFEQCNITEVRESGVLLYIEANSHATINKMQVEGLSVLVQAVNSALDISYLHLSQFSEIAVSGTQLTSLSISDSTFLSGLAGALGCTNCLSVQLSASSFLHCTTFEDSLVMLRGTHKSLATVSDCHFSNNTGDEGVAIWAMNIIMDIKDCNFERNQAESSGGALLLDCSVGYSCQYNISNSRFENNTAEDKGGAIAWTSSKPSVKDTDFIFNSAPYGADIASFPITLSLELSHSRLLSTTIPDMAPGQTAKVFIVAELIDHYGHLVTTDDSSIAELTVDDPTKFTLSGQTKVVAAQGRYNITGFTLLGKPGSKAAVILSSSAIPEPHNPSIPLFITLRACVHGESSSADSCLVCGAGTYSFDPTRPCQNCPQHATCIGRTGVLPESGYWRPELLQAAVVECPRAASCLGGDPWNNGTLNYQGYCAEGYKGTLCQSCDNGFSRAGENQCARCPSRDINIIRIVFVTIGVVLFNAYLVYGALASAIKPKAVHSIYLKILVNYFQLVFLVTEFRLNWPGPVLKLLDAQNSTGGVTRQLYSIDCFLAENADSSEIFFQKQVFLALLPLGMVMAVVLFWTVRASIAWKVEFMRREMTASIVIAFFFIHPTLTISLFSMFSCTQVSEGKYWLTKDMALPCWDSRHLQYVYLVGIPAVVVWVFGVPLICLAILYKYRRQQDEVWIKMRYGFLITGYQRKTYYWEFIILFRKIGVICCSVFITNAIPIQALAVQLVLLLSFFLQYSVNPYFSNELNTMEVRAILVADVTIYCGLFYLTDQLSALGSWIFFACIVGVNALFLAYWAAIFLGYLTRLAINVVPVLGRLLRMNTLQVDEYMEEFIKNSTRKSSNINLTNAKEAYKRMLCTRLQQRLRHHR